LRARLTRSHQGPATDASVIADDGLRFKRANIKELEMATNTRFGGKRTSKASASETELKLSELIENEEKQETPVSASVEPTVEAAAEPAPEPIVLKSTAVARIEEPQREEDVFKTPDLDGWPFAAFELWAENANAFLDFAESLSKAKTLGDIVALQSRFATERYESFVKHTNEIAEATRRFASQAGIALPQGFVAVFSA
jgi:hypothetical protein